MKFHVIVIIIAYNYCVCVYIQSNVLQNYCYENIACYDYLKRLQLINGNEKIRDE